MEIKSEVRKYITENFLAEGLDVVFDDDTPLISGGLVDSIGMIGLVRFIEGRFGIEFLPREVDASTLDTVARIERLVEKKLAQKHPPASVA